MLSIHTVLGLRLILIIMLNYKISFRVCDYQYEKEMVHYTTTNQQQETKFEVPDEKRITGALKDVAYYLRNYKFNEWDRRYSKRSKDLDSFFHAFPMPPLRTLHWKVSESCHNNFYKCIMYLHDVIASGPFTRSDDTVVILKEKIFDTQNTSMRKLNQQCKRALLNAEKSGLPFDTPLEKFQWRTSAAYYMCWYTMLGTPALSMLGEACDNFANCLDPPFTRHNMDVRSDDRLSFACSMYSYCPDPCCPIKHINSMIQCNNHKANPCFAENADRKSFQRHCRINRKENQSLEDIIGNRWNVSCYCKEKGFVWKSRFGICVDINECITQEHSCEDVSEDCLNLPGTYKCVCKWGFFFDKKIKKCVENGRNLENITN